MSDHAAAERGHAHHGDADAGGGRDRHGERDGHEHDDGHSGATDHHHHDVADVSVAVVTVSSSRTLEDDDAGDAIAAAVDAHDGAHVASRDLVTDDPSAIGDAIAAGVEAADVVVTTGGTGISPDDVTVEVAVERFEKALPGFGELFRRRSESAIGDRVMATRATAGVVDGSLVFCLPGSENAARLGTELLLPQVGHLAGLTDR